MALLALALHSLQESAAIMDRLAPQLLRAAVGSVVILGLAALTTLMMGRASAAARHGVWLLAYTGVLLLPALSAALPGWHVLPLPVAHNPGVVLYVSDPPEQERTLLPIPVSARPEAMSPPLSVPDVKHDGEQTAAINRESAANGSPPAPVATPSANIVRSDLSPARQPRLESTVHLSRTGRLALGWALGSALLLARLLLGHVSLWLLRRRCVVICDGDLFDRLQCLRRELKVGRSVELLRSPARSMPMTWGLFRARLLVPEDADRWPAAQQRDVILHELGHLQRWDCLTQLLSQVAGGLYWFNPLAWVAGRRMQIERERACDDLVLNSGANAPLYARHLLQSVSFSSFPTFRLAGAAVAMARPSTLEERMKAILNPQVSRRSPGFRGRVAMVLLLLAAIVPVAGLRAQQTPAAAQRLPASNASAEPVRVREESSATRPTTQPTTRRLSGTIGRPIAPVLGEGQTCDFDATLYDLRMPIELITKLDIAALNGAAGTAESFEKALAALGTAKPMYRANQSIRLSGDTLSISSQSPYVSNIRTTDQGQNINTVSYIATGTTFSLAGKAGNAGSIDLDLNIQLSSHSDSGISLGRTGERMQPIIHTSNLLHKGLIRANKPFVVIAVDAASLEKDGKAVAYIGRVTLGEPQPPVLK